MRERDVEMRRKNKLTFRKLLSYFFSSSPNRMELFINKESMGTLLLIRRFTSPLDTQYLKQEETDYNVLSIE